MVWGDRDIIAQGETPLTKPKQESQSKDYELPRRMRARLGDKIVMWALGIALAIIVIQRILGIN